MDPFISGFCVGMGIMMLFIGIMGLVLNYAVTKNHVPDIPNPPAPPPRIVQDPTPRAADEPLIAWALKNGWSETNGGNWRVPARMGGGTMGGFWPEDHERVLQAMRDDFNGVRTNCWRKR